MFEFSDNKYVSNLILKGINESLRFLAIDNNNNIWASHPYRGIYKMQLGIDKKSFSSELFTEKDGLPSTFRNNVFRIKNRVVFATEEGIYEYDGQLKKFVPSLLLFNVFGRIAIQYLTEDAEGNIWFCNEKKIGVVSFKEPKNQYKITYFPELRGKILAGFENIYTFTNENIFVASNSGIIHINYEKYITENPKLDILLTQVKIMGKSDSVIFGGYFSKTGNAAYLQNKNSILKFPIRDNSFHFEFSSPAYGLQNNIEYIYRLDGYDDNWSTSTLKTEKDYTNLPSGNYTFSVKAHDNLGNESETINYSFVVLPPWYNTIWAYLFYTLLLLLSVFGIIERQKRKFYMQHVKFEEEQNKLKYIHQLEVEKNERKIIELQNEKLINEVIYKNRELADTSMQLVEKSDALLKVKNELQHLYKKTGETHDLKKAIQLVNDIEKNSANWEQFATHFDEVNNGFLKKLKMRIPEFNQH